MSTPSIWIVPASVSLNRGTRLTTVDLPLPVGPTTPTIWPGAIRKVMSRNTGTFGSYPKATCVNSISPANFGGSIAFGRSGTT